MMRRLATPYAVGVAARLLLQVLAFAQMMIASRFLELTEFGTYALAWAAAVIATSFLYTGFYQALLRSVVFEQDRDTAFWSIWAIGASATVIIGGIGLLLGGASTPTGQAFVLLAPVPLFRCYAAWGEAQLLRDKRVRLVSCYPAASEAAALLVTYIGLMQGLGLLALIAGRYTALAGDLLTTGLAGRAFPRLHVSAAAFARLRRTAFPLWGTSAMGMFTQYGADLILGAFVNPAAVGAFRGGSRISQTVSDLVLQPLTILSWSRFTGLEKDGKAQQMGQAWLENMALGAFLLWPILLSVAMLAPEIVSVVFVETWLPAAVVVTILCAARAIRFLTVLLEPTLICADMGRAQITIRLIGAALLLAGLLAFGRFGVQAAAFAHVVSAIVVAVLALRVMLPVLDLGYSDAARALSPGLAVAALCGLTIIGTNGMRASMSPAAGLAVTIGLLAVIWMACLVWGFRNQRLALPQA